MPATEQPSPVASEPVDRVRAHTDSDVRERLDQQMIARISELADRGPAAIGQRLAELDRESDIERVLEINASTLALTGLTLGATVHRRWLLLPAVVLPFLLQHGIQGWCPPIPLLRRLGVRSRQEIDAERYALKAIRGDFDGVTRVTERADQAAQALRALRA